MTKQDERKKRPGAYLRKWRVAKGLSMRDVAKHCQLTAVEYCNLERGIDAPKSDVVERLKQLGVPHSFLGKMTEAGDCRHEAKEIQTVFADWINQETGEFEGGIQEVLTCVNCGKGFHSGDDR